MGKAKFRPPAKSKPLNGLEWNLAQLITSVDYVLEVCPQNKFGDDRISMGFWVNMWNIRCLLLSLFFPKPTSRPHSKPIFTQNFSNDVDLTCNPQAPKTAKIWLDFIFSISGVKSKHPFSLLELHKSVILSSQTGVVDSKYVVVFNPLPIGYVIRGMHSQLFGL